MAAPRFDFAIEDFRIGGALDVPPKLTKQSPRRAAKPEKSLAKSIGAFLLPSPHLLHGTNSAAPSVFGLGHSSLICINDGWGNRLRRLRVQKRKFQNGA
jgi:hypothetical protein